MRLAAGFAVLLALPSLAQAQEGWSETRFHRVHLRNGNFIDGKMIKETAREVTLQLKVGTVSIRLDQIARTEEGQIKVELVKLKSFNEKPPVVPLKGTQPGRTPEPRKPDLPFPPSTAPTQPRTAPVVEPFQPTGDTRQKVDQILEQIRKTGSDEKYQTARLLKTAGEGWAPYLASLLESLDETTRTLAGNVLRGENDAALLPIMRKLLGSGQPAVRSIAVTHLAEVRDAASKGELRGLLRDGDAIVRGAAVSALEALEDENSFDAIGALVVDPDSAVRGAAIKAVRALAGKYELGGRMASILDDALSSAKGEAKLDLISTYGFLGQKDTWPKIAACLREDDPRVKIRALGTLGTLAAPESVDPILELLATERDPEVLSQATVALRSLKSTKAIGPLVELISTTQEITLKSSCSRALREITGQNLGINGEKWAEWYKNQPK